MSFIQVIEYNTSRIDEVQAVGEEWERSTQGKRTASRAIICRDRNDPKHYLQIVFFDSYESAMQNSSLPETQKTAAQMAELVDGSPTFYDLDVVREFG